jgi:excisionase family DNA binding protein
VTDARSSASLSRLLTPAELAEYLSVERSYVYEHASELGAIRLGTGPKARLRFDSWKCAADLQPPASKAGSQTKRFRL